MAPIPPIVAAAAISAAAQGGSAYAQGKMNRATRKWNEKQYDKQRQDSLTDWATVNEYNSPKAQMARFRDAGLNPNLVYGQTNEAAAVRSSDTPAWNPRAPSFEGVAEAAQNTLSSYYDIRLKEANIDNLEKQGTVLVQDALLKASQTASNAQNTATSEFQLSQAKQLNQFVLEAAQANIDKTKADTLQTLDNNERQKALTANTLAQGVESILTSRLNRAKTHDERQNLKQALENMRTDNALKQEDLRLRKMNLQPGDTVITKYIVEFLDKYIAPRFDKQKMEQRSDSTYRKNYLDHLDRLKRKKPGHAPSR